MSLPYLLMITLAASGPAAAETSLTIYNDDFAVIRDTLKLDLHAGANQVRYPDVALYAEPSSVILRDPSGKTELQIQEQAFRGGAVNQETMLAWFEGQTIEHEFVRRYHRESVCHRLLHSHRPKAAR